MSSMTVQRDVAADASVVWRIITDLPRSSEVITAIEAVEVLTDGPFGVGTTWRETRTMFGKTVTEEMTVAEVVDGTSYVVTSRATGTAYRSELEVTSTGDGTSHVTMSFSAEPGSTITKVFASTIGKLFESGTRKALEKDLADIAAAAEGRGTD